MTFRLRSSGIKSCSARRNIFSNETEAVWAIGDHRWIDIMVEPDRAGGAIQTIICHDLQQVIDDIVQRDFALTTEKGPAESALGHAL